MATTLGCSLRARATINESRHDWVDCVGVVLEVAMLVVMVRAGAVGEVDRMVAEISFDRVGAETVLVEAAAERPVPVLPPRFDGGLIVV